VGENQQMIYDLYLDVCKTGDLEAVKKYDCEEFRKVQDFYAFGWAAENRHLEIVNYFMIGICPQKIKELTTRRV
jgi:hypothetical protein